MSRKIPYFFYTVSRGYSLPTSFTSWLVAFTYCLMHNGSISNGIIALIGVTFAHLGTNLFDDLIDTIFKVPKQKCKTEYLDKGIISLKTVAIVCFLYFLIAICTGIYLFFDSGIKVLIISAIAAMIMLAYPKLNHYAMGEAAIAATYGVLLFAGISVVMCGFVDFKLLLISAPVALLIMNLLYAHSLMDYDFDVQNNKKTLCVRLGSKERALNGFLLIGFAALFLHLLLIFGKILPEIAVIVIIPPIFWYYKAYLLLKKYISDKSHQENDFMDIFKLVRNASITYNLLVTIIILLT